MSRTRRVTFTKKQKANLRKQQQKQCCWCGEDFIENPNPNNRRRATVEHLNPLNNNGMDNISNVVMVHNECNLGHKYELGLAISLYIANIRFRPCVPSLDHRSFIIGKPNIFKIMHHDIYIAVTPDEEGKEYKKRRRILNSYLSTEKRKHIKLFFVTYEDEIHDFINMIHSLDNINLSTRPLIDPFRDYQDYKNLVERDLVRKRPTPYINDDDNEMTREYEITDSSGNKITYRRKEKKNHLASKVKKRNSLLALQDNRCLWCWGEFEEGAASFHQGNLERITLEHINPRNNGGSDAIENLGAVHDRCNLHDPYQQGFAVMLYRANIAFETVKFEDPEGHAGALYVFKMVGHDIYAFCEPINIDRADCIKKKLRIADKYLNTKDNDGLGFFVVRNKQEIEQFIQFVKGVEWQTNIYGSFFIDREKPYEHYINRHLGTYELVRQGMLKCESTEEKAISFNIDFYCSGVDSHIEKGTLNEFIDELIND